MSDNSLAIADPFSVDLLDEETEVRALSCALQLAEGFSLLFVRCNQPQQRQRLVVELRKKLPHFNVQEIHFSEPITHLLNALAERLEGSAPDAVFVSGLEYSLPTAADAHATPFVANLNAARNSFPQVVPCPLVLWVPEYVLTAIMRGAPDFFSIRSGVYYFAATPQETAPFVESLTAGEEWRVANMPLEEKQERITVIESLLEDYKALPLARRDHRAEARLLNLLGDFYLVLGQWAKAEAMFQQSLATYRQLGDRVGEVTALNYLGLVYRRQGRWKETEAVCHQCLSIAKEDGNRVAEAMTLNTLGHIYRQRKQWAKAEEHYRRSMAVHQQVGNDVGAAKVLKNLGTLYLDQGRWAEAEAAYQQSLALHRGFGDHIAAAETLSFLGRIYCQQERWEDAETVCKESLAVFHDFGTPEDEAIALNSLGELYRHQGRWAEAEACYQKGLLIRRQLGNPVGEGRTLINFALLREAQGDIAGALEFARQAVAVLEKTEDKVDLEKARELVAKWEGQEEQ